MHGADVSEQASPAAAEASATSSTGKSVIVTTEAVHVDRVMGIRLPGALCLQVQLVANCSPNIIDAHW